MHSSLQTVSREHRMEFKLVIGTVQSYHSNSKRKNTCSVLATMYLRDLSQSSYTDSNSAHVIVYVFIFIH